MNGERKVRFKILLHSPQLENCITEAREIESNYSTKNILGNSSERENKKIKTFNPSSNSEVASVIISNSISQYLYPSKEKETHSQREETENRESRSPTRPLLKSEGLVIVSLCSSHRILME